MLMNGTQASKGSRAEQEAQRVEAAVTRPFLLGRALTWKGRLAQLDFALELEMSKVAA